MHIEEIAPANNSGESSSRMSNTHHQICSESNTDRLSELPEALILQILSCLPIDDAVRTCVLSTRWKNLWANGDRIVFRYDFPPQCERLLQLFISLVDGCLMHSNRPLIKEFSLYFCGNILTHQLLDKWLQRVCQRKVEFLKLEVTGGCMYTAPEWFYNNSSLISLHLHYSVIKILEQDVAWSSLKSLSLSLVVINNEQIAKILLGSPVLQELILNKVQMISELNLVSSGVKKLKVIQYESDIVLKIRAPRLQHLEISGYWSRCLTSVPDVTSLVHANLSLSHPTGMIQDGSGELLFRMAMRLQKTVGRVVELILGPVLIEGWALLKLLGKPPQSFKCRCLTVHLPVVRYLLPGIVYFLQSSPDLETLVIKFEIYRKEDLLGFPTGVFNLEYVARHLSLLNSSLSNLRKIVVNHCQDFHFHDEVKTNSNKECFEFEFLTSVLTKAHALEKLVIRSQKENACGCPSNCGLEYTSLLSHKLSRFCSDRKEGCKCETRKEESDFEIIFSKC